MSIDKIASEPLESVEMALRKRRRDRRIDNAAICALGALAGVGIIALVGYTGMKLSEKIHPPIVTSSTRADNKVYNNYWDYFKRSFKNTQDYVLNGHTNELYGIKSDIVAEKAMEHKAPLDLAKTILRINRYMLGISGPMTYPISDTLNVMYPFAYEPSPLKDLDLGMRMLGTFWEQTGHDKALTIALYYMAIDNGGRPCSSIFNGQEDNKNLKTLLCQVIASGADGFIADRIMGYSLRGGDNYERLYEDLCKATPNSTQEDIQRGNASFAGPFPRERLTLLEQYHKLQIQQLSSLAVR